MPADLPARRGGTAGLRRALLCALLAPCVLAAACSPAARPGTAGTGSARAARPAGKAPAPAAGGPATPAAGGPATPAAGAASAPAAPLANPRPGWPLPGPAYLGRYRLTSSGNHAFAAAGLLTLFMRQILKPKKMIVPSGVLSVYGQDQTTVLYLAQFGHLGAQPVAEVSAGNYGYPPVGLVRVTRFSQARHLLTLTFWPSRGRPVQLTFARYSADPHP